jgi:hypothetical protein
MKWLCECRGPCRRSFDLPVDTYRWLRQRGSVVTDECALREDRTVVTRYGTSGIVVTLTSGSHLVRRLRYKGVVAEARQVNISVMPEAVRQAVFREAQERDMSISSLVVEIVGLCHGLRYDASMTKRQRLREGTGGLLPWVIRMPDELVLALAQRQQANGGRRIAKQRLIVNCLAEHYGLETDSPLNRSLAQPRGDGGRFTGR